MLRPDGAAQYVPGVEKIAEEVVDKIAKTKNSDGELEISPLMQHFATDAISIIFIGSKIGAIEGTEESKDLLKHLNGFMVNWGELVMLPPLIAKYHPAYKKLGMFGQHKPSFQLIY